ncbi:MAG: hypothetical protein ACT4OK_13575 [Gemmobacter sp.]
MTAIILRDSTRPARAIEALVAWHGFWPVARALLAQAWHPRQPIWTGPAFAGEDRLSDHMRRDIGLPPMGAGSPSLIGSLRKTV